MAVHHTRRGMVCALDPCPEDMFVEIWIGQPNGWHVLKTHPIDRYDAAVAFARKWADAMEHSIQIVPITGPEWIEKHRAEIYRAFGRMTDQEAAAMRQECVNSATLLMRDSADPGIRAEAYETLKLLKAVP